MGCGRCSTQCIPDIADPVTVFNMVAEASSVSAKEGEATPVTKTDITSVKVEKPLYVPRPATLKRVEKLTESETLFEIH